MARDRRLPPYAVIPAAQIDFLRSLYKEWKSCTDPETRCNIRDRYFGHFKNSFRAATTTYAMEQLAELPCPEWLTHKFANKLAYLRSVETKAIKAETKKTPGTSPLTST